MEFNAIYPRIIHLDINSCFATIEQQANPLIRNKPVAVCAYLNPNACILASSVDAKKLAIKTGMRIFEAKKIYPKLITLLPDPPKYRFVHIKINKILKNYSNKIIPKSIDEFCFEIPFNLNPQQISKEIKQKIKQEVGEYITVSIGISTNAYLAKIASNLQKPDGLSLINKRNFLEIFSNLKLTDLTGIKKANATRLQRVGIKSVLDFYHAPLFKLKIAFGGITGLYWYLNLHGYEVKSKKNNQRTYGNSYAPSPDKKDLTFPILSKLCEKTSFRFRNKNLKTAGVHLFLQDRNGKSWHMGKKLSKDIFATDDLYKAMKNLILLSPIKNNLRNIAISTFNLKSKNSLQLEFFDDLLKKERLFSAIDKINKKMGNFTVHSARMSLDTTVVQDRISFGQL